MPTAIERPSIDTNLAQRYITQRTGGAYDAKTILTWPKSFGHMHAPLENSLQSRLWTHPGFCVGMSSTAMTNPLGSAYLKGHTTRAYYGAGPRG